MKIEKLLEIVGSDFYTGVPDSQLKPLCNYLIDRYGIDARHHIIAANEGNCTALAAGYHLATGKIPVVYMQNSGEGNIINPVASLLNEKVYAIPMIALYVVPRSVVVVLLCVAVPVRNTGPVTVSCGISMVIVVLFSVELPLYPEPLIS